MTTFVSKDVQAALDAARKVSIQRTSRLRVHVGDEIYAIYNLSGSTFEVGSIDAPRLRGLVDIFDSGKHLYQALIVTSSEEGDRRVYEFKRNTIAATRAALDFYLEPDAPIALLPLR